MKKSQTNITSVNMCPPWNTIWGDIWNSIAEKSQTNAINVTLLRHVQAIWGHMWKYTIEKNHSPSLLFEVGELVGGRRGETQGGEAAAQIPQTATSCRHKVCCSKLKIEDESTNTIFDTRSNPSSISPQKISSSLIHEVIFSVCLLCGIHYALWEVCQCIVYHI